MQATWSEGPHVDTTNALVVVADRANDRVCLQRLDLKALSPEDQGVRAAQAASEMLGAFPHASSHELDVWAGRTDAVPDRELFSYWALDYDPAPYRTPGAFEMLASITNGLVSGVMRRK